MRAPRLTINQQRLLDALKRDVKVLYMPWGGRNKSAYYWRVDTTEHVTVAARKLIKLGLAECSKTDNWRGHTLLLKQETPNV